MRVPWMRLARAQWAPLAALAVLMLVSALLAVAVPARTADGYDRAAEAAIGPTADIRVDGKAQGAAAATAVPGEAGLLSNAVSWQSMLPESLSEVAGEPEPSVTTERLSVAGKFSPPRLLYLGWDTGAWKRIRLVSGAPARNMPGASSGDVQVMVSKRYADQLGYKAGDRIDLGAVQVLITGLYAPKDAADPFWAPRARLLHPVKESIGQGAGAIDGDAGTALIDASGYARVARTTDTAFTFSWRFPIRGDALDAGDAGVLAADLDAFRSAVQGRGDLFPCKVVSALDDRLTEFAGRLHTAESVLGLALGGLAAVAAGVLLLAAGLLGERLRPVLGTMRARGASLRQLAGPACGLTALAAVPSAALGYGAGLLLDAGPPQPSSGYAIAVLLVAVLGVSALMVLRERGGLGSVLTRRDDLVAARPSRRRGVLDVLLVALAVIGVVLLRRRGQDAGTDPLIAAVPVLTGAALGVLVLRVYPYLLRVAGPFLRRRSGAVAFLGIARASRQNLVGALPLVVLLLAATVAGFAATVDTALRDGQVRASWAEIGADARIEAGPLDDAGLRRIRAVPGVSGAVRVRVIDEASVGTDPAPMTVVGVDLGAYRKLAPDVPDIPDSGVLMSPLAATTIGSNTVTLGRAGMDPVRVKPSGQITHFPGQGDGTAFVIVPYKTVAGATGFPSQVFVTGDGLSAEKLRAAAPGHDVKMREDMLRDMSRLPLVSVVHETFQSGAVIGGTYGLLAVVLVLVVGARARGRTIAHLRALGLSRRQSRGLALVEIAPVLLCAVGAGWVLGLFLPDITGPVVDLRPYTGGFAAAAHVPGAPALLGLAGALLLAAAAAVAVDRLFDTDPGNVLRTGE
ncbi:FtsX-like permease family protein [Actinomadura darangshiensis]|uniref:FtsX-like permease family protein n=1 Tax=Actinomadura darangshiensis TaxID=705336 RepID=A0A4R5B7Y0_9ACTN|nr:FtsX-like permease family protein [Actinomadura darangshiensis]TDD80566.1 FtsX-like permease family protein [Actinomadura darangshiensis]